VTAKGARAARRIRRARSQGMSQLFPTYSHGGPCRFGPFYGLMKRLTATRDEYLWSTQTGVRTRPTGTRRVSEL
jgi:hypothetical protein